MTPSLPLLFFVLLSLNLPAQNNTYSDKVSEGETLLAEGKYAEAAICYSAAFKSYHWRGYLPDRLNAARAWAMAGMPDSAYANLFRSAEKLAYGNLDELNADKYFLPLRKDPRWPALYNRVEENSHANAYRDKTDEGAIFFGTGKYAEAAKSYSSAFQAFGWRGSIFDRLNAARAWAMAGMPDSAFSNLFKIVEQGNVPKFEVWNSYATYLEALNIDKYLQPLRADSRWPDLCDQSKPRKPGMPEQAKILEEVFEKDQNGRLNIEPTTNEFGLKSAEMDQLWKRIHIQDSLNQIMVIDILEKYGWLGSKEVGKTGNMAIFLVVQHAPLPVQEKYLPMLREAVKKGNAPGADLALLEDRVLVRNGKKQMYGSQVRRDTLTNEAYFCPIEDVDEVDQRRAAVGLGPLSEYAKHFDIIWNAEAKDRNKKMLPDQPVKK
jgi:tetratricopeptide (TPR) repeat protein